MGFDSEQSVEGWGGRALNSLIRRKQVDSVHRRKSSHHQLAKELTVPHLVAIGILPSSLCFYNLICFRI